MSQMGSAEHFQKAKEWVETFIRRNPEASVIQVARAANNQRLTIPQDVVARIRHEVRLEAARRPFNAVLKIEAKQDKPVGTAKLAPAPTIERKVSPLRPPDPFDAPVASPWNRLGIAPPPVAGFRVETPMGPAAPIADRSPPKAQPPPPEEDDDAGDEEERSATVRRTGVRRKVMRKIQLAEARGGRAVFELECGHGVTESASRTSPTMLCSLCGKAELTINIAKTLRALVAAHGYPMVLETLAALEKEDHA